MQPSKLLLMRGVLFQSQKILSQAIIQLF